VKGVKVMRKTNHDNEVELNYYNEIDEHNRFKGIIKFKSIHCIKLANVLCKDDEMVQKYLSEYYNPEFEQWEVINSLQQLKRDLKAERGDVSEYKEKIKNSIETKNWSWLWVLLQELFLEVLYKEQFEEIVKLIHSNDVDEEIIMNWYNKGKKILAITTFGVDYIKGIQ
jgi:hypothetical protein